jgi:hypothetical protein
MLFVRGSKKSKKKQKKAKRGGWQTISPFCPFSIFFAPFASSL